MSKKGLIFGLCALFFFLAFSLLVHVGIIKVFDLQTTIAFQKIIPRAFDTPFSVFSLLGSFEFVGLILLLLFALTRKLSYIFVLGFFGLFHLVEFVGKTFVNHAPPPISLLRYDLPFSFPSSSVSPGFSYPSGHAGRTAFLIVVVLFLVWDNKKISRTNKMVLSFTLFVFSLVMFFSRIYLGEHWLSDVLGGILLGAALAFISSFLIPQTKA